MLLVLVIMVFTQKSVAQTLVGYPTPAQQVEVCNGSSLLTVRLDISIASTTGCIVSIDLPDGISYVPSTVVALAGTTSSGMTIIENGGTPNIPVFTVNKSGGFIVGNFITFTIARKADCLSKTRSDAGVVFKDIISTTINGTTNTENSPTLNAYLIKYATLSFVAPVTQTNAVTGTNYVRTFTVTNGSNYNTNAVHFSIDYPANGITPVSLTLEGNPVTELSASGTTHYYSVSGAFLGADNLLTNGESLTFTETYKIKTCDGPTNYSIGWGCSTVPSGWCQTLTGTGNVTMATGVPNFNSFTVAKIGYVNDCTPYSFNLSYKNNGIGNVKAAALYNANFRVGASSGNVLGSFAFNIVNLGNATISGNAISHTGGTTSGIYVINVKDALTTDPDGAGVGLEDLDGDGFFDDLPMGATVTFSVIANINCSAYSCVNGGTQSLYYGLRGDIQYTTMCNSTVVTPPCINDSHWSLQQGTVNATYMSMVSQLASTTYAPANITGGTPFTMRYSLGWYFAQEVNFNPNQRFIYEITLPAGLTVSGTGNPKWVNGANTNSTAYVPTTFSQVGNILTVLSPSTTLGMVYLDMVYTCGTSGPLTVPFKVKYINDYGSSCSCNSEWFCGSYTIANAICPSGCLLGGPSVSSIKVERADNSLGWTDATLAIHTPRNLISAYELSKALPLDDIDITANAVQNTVASTNLYLKVGVKKLSGANADKLTPNSIDVVIKRAGVVVGTGTANTFASTGTSATKQYVVWNLTSTLPSGGILPNDVIETVSHYTVSGTNLDYPSIDTQTGETLYFYNLDVSNAELTCNSVVPEMYLVGFSEEFFRGSNSLTISCNNNSAIIYTANRFASSGASYLNEVRPGFQVKTIQITVPTGYEMLGLRHTNNTPNAATYLTPTSVAGNVYNYSITPVTENLKVTNTYNSIYYADFKPTCASPNTTSDLGIIINGQSKYYHYKDIGTPNAGEKTLYNSPNQSMDYLVAKRPTITLTNQTGVIQANAPTESWTVRLASTGTVTAPYTWLALPTTAGVNIINVLDINNGNTVVPFTTYTAGGGGKMYQISTTGLVSGATNDYKIEFSYTACVPTTQTMYAGWNCSAFPTDPVAYVCSKAQVDLQFTTAPAALSLQSVQQPSATYNLCTNQTNIFEVGNVQQATIYNNKMKITMPTGMSIDNATIQVEYPRNSGIWATVPAAGINLSGSLYTIDMTTASNYPSVGLSGTLTSGGDVNNTKIALRYNTTTTCDFISGSTYTITTSANNSCASVVSGSNMNQTSVENKITGTNIFYATVQDISIVSGSIAKCGEPITYSNGSTVLQAGPTRSTGVLYFEYPSGFNYITGSFACTASGMNFCPTVLGEVTLPNGNHALRLSVPAGMGNGQTLNYTVQLIRNNMALCGNTDFVFRGQDSVSGLTCVSSGTICTGVQVITGPVVTKTYNFACTKDPVAGTTLNPSKIITTLNRSNYDPASIDKRNGYLVLESKTKGFVITRMTTTQISAITIPIEGMIVFDTTVNCLKLYTGSTWVCVIQRCN